MGTDNRMLIFSVRQMVDENALGMQLSELHLVEKRESVRIGCMISAADDAQAAVLTPVRRPIEQKPADTQTPMIGRYNQSPYFSKRIGLNAKRLIDVDKTEQQTAVLTGNKDLMVIVVKDPVETVSDILRPRRVAKVLGQPGNPF